MTTTKERIKEIVSKKIEEITGGKEDDDFYIEEVKDLGNKYRVIVNIDYMYEYLNEEDIKKLLKAFDHAYIKATYIGSLLVTTVELEDDKLKYDEWAEDYDDIQVRLIAYMNK